MMQPVDAAVGGFTRGGSRAAALRSWRISWRTFGVAALIVLVAVAAGLVLEHLTDPRAYPVRRVHIDGNTKYMDRAALSAALREAARGNFFLVDLEGIRRTALAQPWVRRAEVRRLWPDTVRVWIEEHTLAAHWNERLWVNREGEVVDLRGATAPEGLPRLSGPIGSAETVLAEYHALNMHAQAIGAEVRELTLSPRRTWSVRLSNGLLVLLGREHPGERMRRFVSVYAAVVGEQVASVKQVDLRYTNGFTVEWGTAPPAPQKG